jgi:hypothetical protein
MFVGERAYPAPTIAMLKSLLGSNAIVAKLGAARVSPGKRRERVEA